MALVDALKSIATLGYTERQRALKLEEQIKSLRDGQVAGGPYGSGTGSVGVLHQTGKEDRDQRLFKKQTVRVLRNYAEYSVWVRSCINIYRAGISQVEWQVVPYVKDKPCDPTVKAAIEKLLRRPNGMSKSYSRIKEEFVEDYLVLGHGVMLKKVNRAFQTLSLDTLDAALFAFYPDWNGKLSSPRYAVLDKYGTDVSKRLASPEAAVLVNSPRSYDLLGLSHVEILDKTTRAMLEGDDYLLTQVLQPQPNGLLNLGRGISQPQVDETRTQIAATRKPFVIVGGTENVDYVPFNANESQIRVLDTMEWFVSEVCSVFQLPVGLVKATFENTKANTDAILEYAGTGIENTLRRIRDMENEEFVLPFGDYEEHNCIIDYPILNRTDEEQEAAINKIALANVPFRTINEARAKFGDAPLEDDLANQIIIPVMGGAPISLEDLGKLTIEDRKLRGGAGSPDSGGQTQGENQDSGGSNHNPNKNRGRK